MERESSVFESGFSCVAVKTTDRSEFMGGLGGHHSFIQQFNELPKRQLLTTV